MQKQDSPTERKSLAYHIARLRLSLSKKATARWATFWADYLRFRRQSQKDPRFPKITVADTQPCLTERTATTSFDRHYVYHTAWAARVLRYTSPTAHSDIGSLVYFSSLVSAFIPFKFYDYRPAPLDLSGLDSNHADLCNLPFPDDSIESLSCMHVVEHIGLGRYGDPIDPQGDERAMKELQRVLAPGGQLLFVVPVGRARICFNAHRVYSYMQIIEAMSGLELVEFSLIPDDTNAAIIKNAAPELVSAQTYGCGCFWFQKPTPVSPLPL